jgi:hypothetical protein
MAAKHLATAALTDPCDENPEAIRLTRADDRRLVNDALEHSLARRIREVV